MNKIICLLFISFCLYAGVNNKIVKSQYTIDNKYCIENEDDTYFDKFHSFMDGLKNTVFNIHELLRCISDNDPNRSYSDKVKSSNERVDEFHQNFPRSYLMEEAEKLKVNCILYDKRIDMLDNGSIKETPYNFRPLK